MFKYFSSFQNNQKLQGYFRRVCIVLLRGNKWQKQVNQTSFFENSLKIQFLCYFQIRWENPDPLDILPTVACFDGLKFCLFMKVLDRQHSIVNQIVCMRTIAVFVLRTHYPSIWTNLGKHFQFVGFCISSIKTGTTRIMRLEELSFENRLERRMPTTKVCLDA